MDDRKLNELVEINEVLENINTTLDKINVNLEKIANPVVQITGQGLDSAIKITSRIPGLEQVG